MTNKQGLLLIVDDIKNNRTFLSSLLEDEGYNSLEAESGQECISLIEQNNISLVLLDFMMPEMNGIETLKIIRSKYSLLELPVIMVTAKDQPEYIVEALEAGANDYITKPVDVSVAVARIFTHYSLSIINKESKEREQRYQRLSEISFEGIVIHNNGLIMDFNQTFSVLSGYQSKELTGKNLKEVFYPGEYENIFSTIIEKNDKYIEANLLRKDGTLYSAEVISRDIIYNGSKAKVTAIRDVTARKQYESLYSKLQENIAKMENIDIPEITEPTVNFKIEINKKSLTIKSMGKNIYLTLGEFNLLTYLYDNQERVISIDELLENVFNYPPGTGNPDTIRTHITRIRNKIENEPSKPEIVVNIPRAGYKFNNIPI